MLTINLTPQEKLFFDSNLSAQLLSVPLDVEMKIFRKASIIKPSFSQNLLGMYTLIDAGRDKTVKFGSFTTPKAVLKKRGFGCVWNPNKCAVQFESDELTLCDLDYQRELCTDFSWNSCFEKLMGIGNDSYDINGSAESSLLLAMIMEKEHIAIGNSYYDVGAFGAHPLVEQANTNAWYNNVGTTATDWTCFYDQMKDCQGYMTIIDSLKASGLNNFNVQIFESDVNGDAYTGSPIELFQRIKQAQSTRMRLLAKQQFNGQMVIGVTRGIFDKYKDDLITLHSNVPQAYYLRINGETADCDNCLDGTAPGVLKWDNYWIVCMEEWSTLDDCIGTTTHRAILMVPGVIGLAYAVAPNAQFNGMGMQVISYTAPPHLGMTYFWATFRQGTTILDEDLMVSAELTLLPA